jgi:hypothetical protein
MLFDYLCCLGLYHIILIWLSEKKNQIGSDKVRGDLSEQLAFLRLYYLIVKPSNYYKQKLYFDGRGANEKITIKALVGSRRMNQSPDSDSAHSLIKLKLI